jgi:hypothetical protein
MSKLHRALISFCCGNTKKQKKTRLLRDKAPRNDNSINVRRHCEESSTKQSSLFFCIFLLPQQKLIMNKSIVLHNSSSYTLYIRFISSE